MENKLILGVISTLVIVTLLGSVLVPVIDSQTEGERITNDGAGWLRMEYNAAPTATYQIAADNVSNEAGLLVHDGSATQIGDVDTIIYASSNLTCWMQDGLLKILGQNGDGAFFVEPEESFIVKRDSTGVELTIDNGETPYLFAAPEWAYVPKSTGNFGFFDAGTPVDMNNYPVAAVGGGFAGVYGFNGLQTYGLGLQLQTELDEDGKLTGGTWVKAAAVDADLQDFDPSTITITPLDPGVISLDPEPDVSIMTVPTPSYTEGDWGYNTQYISGHGTMALIVSYSGTGGDIVVPATIGGYSVYQFGIGNAEVFDNNSLSANSTITFSEGIEVIGNYACNGARKLTGPLVIPEGVTSIGDNAFYNTVGLTSISFPSTLKTIGNSVFNSSNDDTVYAGTLVLPDGLTSIGSFAFSGLTHITGNLYIPPSVTTINSQAFKNTHITSVIINTEATTGINSSAFSGMSLLTEVLDVSDAVDYSANRHGIRTQAEVSDSIGDAMGYVSFIEIGSDAPLSGSAATLLVVIPAVLVVTLLIAAVGWFVYNRY